MCVKGFLVFVLILGWSQCLRSHAVGSHDWLPQKNWGPRPPERQDKLDTIISIFML